MRKSQAHLWPPDNNSHLLVLLATTAASTMGGGVGPALQILHFSIFRSKRGKKLSPVSNITGPDEQNAYLPVLAPRTDDTSKQAEIGGLRLRLTFNP